MGHVPRRHAAAAEPAAAAHHRLGRHSGLFALRGGHGHHRLPGVPGCRSGRPDAALESGGALAGGFSGRPGVRLRLRRAGHARHRRVLRAGGHRPSVSQLLLPRDAWLFYLLCASTVALVIGYLGWLYEGQTLKNLREAHNDLRKAHAALQASNQRIERILESITDGFFALDRSWRFTYVNPQAERILGFSREDLLERPVQDVFIGRVGEHILEQCWNAARHGRAGQLDVYYPPLERWFSVSIYPYGEGVSVYLSDISERKAYEAQLVEARNRAEELARLKSAFLTNMSHEIRTPLAGIIGLADTLSREVEGEHREFAHLIDQSAQRLMDTLCSILDLAQLESGNVTSHLEPVDVLKEAQEVVRLLTPVAQERGLTLRVQADTSDTTAMLDTSFLHRILHNLVGNALKFTEEGGVTVQVAGDQKTLWIRVIDTGIGIPAEFMPHLFEEFRQASTGLRRSHEGSGLGLAITKRLVTQLRGTIDVESHIPGGTVVTVRFPRF
ncbi:hypothetical protein AWN76_012915 [Rhodothermaceae bacterium RA]|nr:hypothetical protein AWN76_012915 [Rhodothermaceae bacterium RA]